MVAYKREKLVFVHRLVHRSLGSWERKYVLFCMEASLQLVANKLREEGHGVGRRKS